MGLEKKKKLCVSCLQGQMPSAHGSIGCIHVASSVRCPGRFFDFEKAHQRPRRDKIKSHTNALRNALWRDFCIRLVSCTPQDWNCSRLHHIVLTLQRSLVQILFMILHFHRAQCVERLHCFMFTFSLGALSLLARCVHRVHVVWLFVGFHRLPLFKLICYPVSVGTFSCTLYDLLCIQEQPASANFRQGL